MERHGCGLGVVDYSDRCHAAGTVVERSGHKGNWANRNRGVVLVFVIVFIVVVGIIAL
jgi:hypothetical protein